METQILPPELSKLGKLIAADAAELKSLFTTFTAKRGALVHAEEMLATARADREERASRRDDLIAASPVELLRRGLDAEGASTEAEALQGKVDAAREREEKAASDGAQHRTAQSECLSQMKALIREVVSYGQLYSEGTLQCELLAMTGPDTDISRVTEGGDRFFALTAASRIYRDREFKARRLGTASEEEILVLAQEIISEPIVALRQGAPRLPHPNNSGVVRDIAQVLNR